MESSVEHREIEFVVLHNQEFFKVCYPNASERDRSLDKEFYAGSLVSAKTVEDAIEEYKKTDFFDGADPHTTLVCGYLEVEQMELFAL